MQLDWYISFKEMQNMIFQTIFFIEDKGKQNSMFPPSFFWIFCFQKKILWKASENKYFISILKCFLIIFFVFLIIYQIKCIVCICGIGYCHLQSKQMYSETIKQTLRYSIADKRSFRKKHRIKFGTAKILAMNQRSKTYNISFEKIF